MSKLGSILEDFADAELELLAKRQLLRRVDSKFLLSEDDLGGVLGRVISDYGLIRAGGERLATYRTVYFDTPELRCFHDHRRGRRPRQKVRIRHYDDRSVSYLEVKTKRSEMISAKKRRQLPFDHSILDEDGRAFVGENSRLPRERLERAASTDFQRATLVGLQTNERLTIDVNMSVSLKDGEPNELGPIVILEVKQARFSARTPIMAGLSACGHRPTSASKYCTATALLRPGIRANRLLPALRAIERLRQWAT